MTNLEWMRTLSANELVDFLSGKSCRMCAYCDDCTEGNHNCTRGKVKWLNSEHKEELKPCPFCGSKNVYIHSQDGYADKTTIIFCNDCKSTVFVEDNEEKGYDDKTIDRAIRAWNRRDKE